MWGAGTGWFDGVKGCQGERVKGGGIRSSPVTYSNPSGWVPWEGFFRGGVAPKPRLALTRVYNQ
jgi:hypothetical protein